MLMSAENLLTGNIWKWFMANPEIPHAMELAGFSLPPGPPVEEKAKPPAKKVTKPRTRHGTHA